MGKLRTHEKPPLLYYQKRRLLKDSGFLLSVCILSEIDSSGKGFVDYIVSGIVFRLKIKVNALNLILALPKFAGPDLVHLLHQVRKLDILAEILKGNNFLNRILLCSFLH